MPNLLTPTLLNLLSSLIEDKKQIAISLFLQHNAEGQRKSDRGDLKDKNKNHHLFLLPNDRGFFLNT